MAAKNISFLIDMHHPYIRHVDGTNDFRAENVLLFEKISNVYIPLIKMLDKFQFENLKARIALVFSAPLCTLLSDAAVKDQYVAHLEKLISFGKKELLRTKGNKELNKNAAVNLERTEENLRIFREVLDKNLIKAFAQFAKNGTVEILATCGTGIFMPHYIDMPEILNAQVEVGINAVRNFFGINAEGFYLPELGYAPGVEKILRMYGINYTILPAQSFLLSSTTPEKGIFAPARCYNCLSLFPANLQELEYNTDSVYRNQNKDVAWDLEAEELVPFIKKGQARVSTGFCYWNNSFTDTENSAKDSKKSEYIYNEEEAYKKAYSDALDFTEKNAAKLESAGKALKGTDVSMTFVFNEDMLQAGWAEGFVWFEYVIRDLLAKGIGVKSFSDLLFDKFALQKITPYFAAGNNGSYGEEFISSKNGWMIRYLRKACDRIVDLADRFPDDTGLKVRLLNLGARELMIAQDIQWAKMIENNTYAEYAEKVFRECISSFTAVFDSLGSNTVSTEWLCNLEKEHSIFPWMNYRVFSKKR